MKRVLSILTLGILLSACEIPFDIKQEGEAQIYVQCVAGPDGVSICPQYATPIGQTTRENVSFDVRLQVNEQSVAAFSEDGRYFYNLQPLSEGDEVAVEIRADGVPVASGHTSLVARPVITEMRRETVETPDSLQMERVSLVLDHTPSQDDHYAIQIINSTLVFYSDGSTEEYESYLIPTYIRSEVESLSFDLEDYIQVDFDGHRLANDGDHPLTLLLPRHFRNNTYTFYLGGYEEALLDQIRYNMPEGDTGMAGGGITSGDLGEGGSSEEGEGGEGRIPIAQRIHNRFVLYSMSDEFFYFFKAVYQSNFDFLSNMGLTPANFTYSNVSGGLGMVGAISGESREYEVLVPLFEY